MIATIIVIIPTMMCPVRKNTFKLFLIWIQASLIICQNATETTMSNRMGQNHSPLMAPQIQLPNLYNVNRFSPFKPLHHHHQHHYEPTLPNLANLGNLGNLGNLAHLAPHLMTNGLVPIAVSISLGFLLIRLLAFGIFMLEKELLYPFGWKMDSKMDPAQAGRILANTNLLPLMERFQKAMDKYNNLNNQPQPPTSFQP